ncbi:exonuclease SbcCD subunit D [Lentibacillus saliphilus]|uniref:exonuclease SbcCD subunit D n=1 Tax=Lentibacillus saliphilus TaxID=2737028 RepID=UPI001C30DE4D|nr:exonuclease SbcCD subunit D [Lentibacillus saliphilus]
MKIFHTADWHLGKLVQGVYMTDDQKNVLDQFIHAVEQEQPDVVLIAGDLYDRAVPPTDAVHLLDEVLEKIIIELRTPVIAIAGNHDSPSRLHFGSHIMEKNGLFLTGRFSKDAKPVVLKDNHGDVHFHLVPYCDPSIVRHEFALEDIRSHNDAMRTVVQNITEKMDPKARHVFVGHAFVTPHGEPEANTSESERPLSIGGSEHVDAHLFTPFHYTALGHLHQAHYVLNETIRYAGSPLKFSSSEVHHNKGYLIIEMDAEGHVDVEKRALVPQRDMRIIETTIGELLQHEGNDDYVFIRLTDETPVLSPMEKVRSIYPNAMHVERATSLPLENKANHAYEKSRTQMDELELFRAFYKEVEGKEVSQEMEMIFKEVLDELLVEEDVIVENRKNVTTT